MNLDCAPERGTLYALYIDRVEYKKYEKKELFMEKDLEENLLELHLFDDREEYRYIKTRSGEIQKLIKDSSVIYDELYIEQIYTLNDKKERTEGASDCVEVVNYITFDENDFIRIENYRLKEVR